MSGNWAREKRILLWGPEDVCPKGKKLDGLMSHNNQRMKRKEPFRLRFLGLRGPDAADHVHCFQYLGYFISGVQRT